MSSIDKLSIRGIRSFSPGRDESIDFNQPLTVILGANGCGKTTIIECLKISCTGLLPPGARSGQTFVHDPKIRGDVEVKGSVRLRFTSRAGQTMVVQRTYRLQQKKNAVTFAAMDGVIRMVNEHGEKVSMNHKCSDLDKHIPSLLGVSKAVLDSVIFCHQEDSNWPLQEGKVLKSRFDDIFESARYTKALEAIRKLKLDRTSQGKDLKRDLDVINEQVKRARELEEQLEVRQTKLEALKLDQNAMSDNIDALERNAADATHDLAESRSLHAELVQKDNGLASMLQEIQRNYRVNPEFKEMSESTAQLTELLANYDVIVATNNRQVEMIESQESQLQTTQATINEKVVNLRVNKGLLLKAIERLRTAAKARAELACDMGRKHAFGSFPSLSTSQEQRQFWARFQEALLDKETALKTMEQDSTKVQDQWNSTINKLETQLNQYTLQIDHKNAEMADVQKEEAKVITFLQGHQRSASESTSSQRELSQLEAKLAELEAKLQASKDSHATSRLRDETVAIDKELNSLSFDLKIAQDKVNVLRGFEKEESALEHSRRDVCARKAGVHENLTDPKFAHLLPHQPTEASLDQDVNTLEALAETCKRTIHESHDALRRCEAQATELNLKKQQEENTVSKLRKELDQLELGPMQELQRIFSAYQLLQPETAVAQLETMYMEAKDKTVSRKNAVMFLKTYKKKGEKEHCCPLCHRGMTPDELAVFSKLVADKMDDSKNQEKIHKAERLEQQAFEVWKQTETLMPSWHRLQAIQKDLPARSDVLNDLYKQSRALELDLTQTRLVVQQNEAKLSQVVEGWDLLKALKKSYDQVEFDAKKVAASERDLASRLADSLGSNPPTMSMAQEALESMQTKCRDLETKLKQKQAEVHAASDALMRLQGEVHRVREEKHQLNQRNIQLEKAKDQRESLRAKLRKLQEELATAQRDVPSVQRELQIKVNEREISRLQLKDAIDAKRAELTSCQQDLQLVQRKHEEVDEMQKQNDEAKLHALDQELQQLHAQSERISRDIAMLQPEKTRARSSLSETESFKRQIRDNIQFRQLRDAADKAKEDLEAFKRKMDTFRSVAEAENACRVASETLNAAKEERAKLAGKQDNLQENVREVQVQLAHRDLKNIDEKKRHKFIEFETTMMAVSDLDKYYKALDMSLMQFHSQKIEEINAIIRSLWQITYRGQDIDTIEIVSGHESGDSNSKRSYNYRVVMRKDSAVLDMRGRCSAGQKVLAGLVIRLALAETFCLNCGILALDEPTTNLDSANKLGLAQAISDILIAREKQQNFQLICITHDEEFVQMLNRSQMLGGSRPEYLWTVSREEIAPRYFVSKIDKRPWSSDFVYRPTNDI
ncbi:hypothetical protein H257_12631 [Aphanomyces astaci]|uniref:DNA repair protein RAD50 n=2 Tax=Aphanomyces astaci TaxID=112090 RepID=W4FZV4_APHAT|nr:hypothetical protein H257_12631 [Aphanomyces astaci]ETV72541.1 hypothetical protein H257_12631 [Aphanomyces astaci]|eukprot:XP_009838223.1 hypothetical protein H257_12631 [Aphanomyces astaci]